MDWKYRDAMIRRAAFEKLSELQRAYGNSIPWSALEQGFTWNGEHRFLTSKAEGIYKPKDLPSVLSVKTTVPRLGRQNPYSDELSADGTSLRYAYRARGGPDSTTNESLRVALRHKLPIIYLAGVAPGVYSAMFPMFVVSDFYETHEFGLAPGAGLTISETPEFSDAVAETPVERKYASRQVLQRLHQKAFREQVLGAYNHHCAMCSIHFDEFLDAAHILPDSHLLGVPDVRNGLSLCGLHHKAFDRHLVDIDDNYRIQLSPELLRRTNGPLFTQAFLQRHDQELRLPKREEKRPGLEFLRERRTQRPAQYWTS